MQERECVAGGTADGLSLPERIAISAALRTIAEDYRRTGVSTIPGLPTVEEMVRLADRIDRAFEVIILNPPLDPRRN